MYAAGLANLVFFLCGYHNLSSVVQTLWLFIAISNCWSAISVMRKCNRTTSNTKPNVVTLSHRRISETAVFVPHWGPQTTSCTVSEVFEFRKLYVATKGETTYIYLTMMVISEIIQGVYKRMVRFQKLIRNLFLTLHGHNFLQASACKTNTTKYQPQQKLPHTTNWEQDDQCGNSSTQSQAPNNGYINVRNMLST